MNNDILNWISVAGSLFSLIGIIITICQVKKIKNASEAAKAAAEDTNSKIKKTFSIENLSKCMERVSLIQDEILQNKLDAAHIRLQQLHAIIIELKEIPEFSNMQIMNDLRSSTPLLGSIVKTVQKYKYKNIKEQQSLEKDWLIEDLQKILEILSELEAQLKHNEHLRHE